MIGLPETLTDHPSLVGIIRFPCLTTGEKEEVYIPIINNDGENWSTIRQKVTMSKTINSVSRVSPNATIPKSKITDFYPYTYYVLTDGESEPLILHPQYMPNTVNISSNVALSHQPVERYYIPGYKGDMTGNIYNITNLNQMMLPTATNEGIGYMSANANTIMQNRKTQVTSNILNGVNGVASTVAGGMFGGIVGGITAGSNAISSTISGVNAIKNIDARNKDLTLTPNSIASFGTPSTRDKFNNNKVRLLKYTIDDKYKLKVNNFVKRFGYKYNSYSKVDLKSYKGYLKISMPDINGKIDNMYINKIISILERGVYVE